MNKMDYNCFVGEWPFYKTRHGSFEDLLKLHKENGIQGGYVSSLQAVFYNDPFEAEISLAEDICHHAEYHHIMTVNPTLPAWRENLLHGVKEFSVVGVRIIPEFHGYSLKDACMMELVNALEQLQLPLFINLHMVDARVSYLLYPMQVPIPDLRTFLIDCPLQIYLCGIRVHEIEALEDVMMGKDHIHFDVAGLKDKIFIMEELFERGLCSKMVYGSQTPMLCMKSTKVLIDLAEIPDQVKEGIWLENIDKILRI